MRLLFLAHRLPYPPHKGDKIRALNILRFLARRHEVHLGCLIDDPNDLSYLGEVRQYVGELLFERIHPGLRKLLALTALARAQPISVDCFYSRRLQRRVDDLIEKRRIEGVFCFSSQMAEYVFRSRHAASAARPKRVMDLIDVDSLKWRQYAQESPPWSAWIYRREARCLGAYEERIAREFDRVLVVSEQERGHFPGADRHGRIEAMSNGVDLEFFSPAHPPGSMLGNASLVFTGVMDYRPNVEGVRWFVEHVFPRIRSQVPAARVFIVGNRPTAEVRRLERHRGVSVTGFVPDIRDYLAGATACVAPLRIARGIQNKVLEAMAMGRPVVTTPAAYEGIQATSGTDLVVADTEEAFATATVELLQNPAHAARIGRNARACVERRYSWATNLRVLEEIFTGAQQGPIAYAQ